MRVIVANAKGTLKDYEVTLADHGHHIVQTVITRTRYNNTEFYLRLVPPHGVVWNRAVAAAKERVG